MNKKIELSGEQKIALTLPTTGTILIKGGAGSGKTLVSVKRAECLMEENPDMFRATRVAIFTYTRELVSAISAMADKKINVYGLDSWVFRFLGLDRKSYIYDNELKLYRESAVNKVLNKFRDTRAIARKSDDFYCAEISWLKGRCISSLEQYKNTRRTGRGTDDRVTQADRELLWDLFSCYNGILKENGVRDWDDRILDALAIVEKPGFRRPFSHIVIDEAQDFSFSRIRLLRGLVSDETNSITIVADTAQQIYQSGFSWSDLGFNVRGSRSIEFKHNYRNTKQISEAAYSLMNQEKDKIDFTEMIPSTREGDKPVVITADKSRAFDALVNRVRQQRDYSNTVIAVPTRKLVSEYDTKLTNVNVRVPVMTYHSLKGLQYEHVYLMELSSRYFNIAYADLEEISKMRKLVYVAMTRACHDLTIFTEDDFPPFLTDIDSKLIERVRG